MRRCPRLRRGHRAFRSPGHRHHTLPTGTGTAARIATANDVRIQPRPTVAEPAHARRVHRAEAGPAQVDSVIAQVLLALPGQVDPFSGGETHFVSGQERLHVRHPVIEVAAELDERHPARERFTGLRVHGARNSRRALIGVHVENEVAITGHRIFHGHGVVHEERQIQTPHVLGVLLHFRSPKGTVVRLRHALPRVVAARDKHVHLAGDAEHTTFNHEFPQEPIDAGLELVAAHVDALLLLFGEPEGAVGRSEDARCVVALLVLRRNSLGHAIVLPFFEFFRLRPENTAVP